MAMDDGVRRVLTNQHLSHSMVVDNTDVMDDEHTDIDRSRQRARQTVVERS